MMTTEDEARKKWCPLVRTGLTAGMAVNYHIGTVGSLHAGDVHEETRCIASGCMMWRWHQSDSGYCGLAGGPQVVQGISSHEIARGIREEKYGTGPSSL